MKPLVTLCLLLLFSPSISALDFEKLFMPGKVISGHKKYENDCKKCHSRLENTTQDKLCRDCHEKIHQDMHDGNGFHGKSKSVTGVACKICHADHQGRDADIVHLDIDRFNHSETDFELRGKHTQTDCKGCHKNNEKFREAPLKCISCHKEDDVHEEKLGDECNQCHNPKAWGGVDGFDHDKTDFKLLNSHEKVACDSCHISPDYKDTPKECIACHAIKDVHQERFGEKCNDCHNEKEWPDTHFNHDKETKFRLKSTHKRVDCHTCHSVKYNKKRRHLNSKKTRTCINCHRLDDVHKGENGKKCEQCHNEKKWSENSFNHNKKTKFPLKGAHKKANCQACHTGDKKDQKPDKDCYNCHEHQDSHDGQEGKLCDNCHNDRSWWMEDIRFEHDLTEFPLIGLHAVTACESCHLSSRFKDVDTACNGCHEPDDVHKKSLGEECRRCHNPNSWLIWEFDHDSTEFELIGSHKEVHCHACHREPLEKDRKNTLEPRCKDCHSHDDVHAGRFGSDCDECHSQDEFRSIDIDQFKFGR